jgi:hypothetical protein
MSSIYKYVNLGIKYNKLDMSDCVENSDEQIQIKAFKEAADIIDRILEDVKMIFNWGLNFFQLHVLSHLIQFKKNKMAFSNIFHA